MRKMFFALFATAAFALSPAQAVEVSDLPGGLVAFWVAGEQGDEVPDLSGNGYDGTIMGEEIKPERVESEFLGNVLHFRHHDRTGGPVVGLGLERSMNPPRPEMTLAAWVKLDPEGERTNNYVFNRSGAYEFAVWRGRVFLRYSCPEGEETEMFTTDTDVFNVRPGNWHFIAATHNGEEVNIYIDGKRILSGEASMYPTQATRLYMGNFSGRTTTTTFNGCIGPALIFNRALGEVEISEILKLFFR